MKKFWKWVMWILIGLIILAAVIAVIYCFRNVPGEEIGLRELPGRAWKHPMMRFKFLPQHPMMGIQTFPHFAGGWMVFFMGLARLIPLALLGLIVYGAYRLGSKKAFTKQSTPVTAPTVSSCSNCGQEVQDAWKHCPYCGTEKS